MNKLFISTLLVTLAVVFTAEAAKMTKEEAKAKLFAFGKDCAGETGATSDDIDALLKKTVPESKTGKCMVNCIYKKLGVMKDGKYNAEGAIAATAMVHDEGSEVMEKVKKISEKCAAETTGADECEAAANGMACGLKMAKEQDLMSEIPV